MMQDSAVKILKSDAARLSKINFTFTVIIQQNAMIAFKFINMRDDCVNMNIFFIHWCRHSPTIPQEEDPNTGHPENRVKVQIPNL